MSICDALKTLVPEPVYNEFINSVVEQYEINTPLRASHFLSQCAHESANFTRTSENLNYSAEGLLRVFDKYFTRRQAYQYARKPILIGSRVYANRMGNGSEASQEGYKYRGRGYIQLTGKDSYKLLNELVEEDIVEEPALVATKYPLLSAAWFWKNNSLNNLADLGADQVENITRVVNGGTNGLDDRRIKFSLFYDVLKEFETEPEEPAPVMVTTDRGLIQLDQLEAKDVIAFEENSRIITTEWYLGSDLVRKDVSTLKLNMEL